MLPKSFEYEGNNYRELNLHYSFVIIKFTFLKNLFKIISEN